MRWRDKLAKTQTPLETFLAPLARLLAKFPELEAEVIWATDTGWQAQEGIDALLDADEISFYAEGLLLEGFALQWQAFAETIAPTEPAHIRLFFWQITAPALPEPEAGLLVVAQGRWAI